jgi:hypothetical protein
MFIKEIDRLSSAWGLLDEQCSNKVFNLVGMEDKISKVMSEVRLFSLTG